MPTIKIKLALGLASVASLSVILGTVAPASADATSSGVTFWSGAFAGQPVTYADPSADCTTLPFTVHSEFNNTGKSIQVYKTTDCTGQALTFPATDIHSFTGFDGRSFRATS
ncbi:peptidase inhibitor family I36 protein [Streptosporangium sp. 'caverna']|uniref:peptidase inhibitor family I36 protein n=1 Tax=Streptosporangium sp. 'caverna' TaxID=2202249 RepID=UPI000D7DD09F|nr:peptidase inhibitor family I36 protein [Streptosporangium sp. 'caverna']AWS46490.1 hypothetical protein DKM19_39510 [Streptosporangium sp. 'caverna']